MVDRIPNQEAEAILVAAGFIHARPTRDQRIRGLPTAPGVGTTSK